MFSMGIHEHVLHEYRNVYNHYTTVLDGGGLAHPFKSHYNYTNS